MILIATPTRADVTAGFTADLVKLCRRSPDTRWVALLGIYISDLRQRGVSLAQKLRASHVLFLDSDMRFPDDALDLLLSWELPIVGANYVQRTMPEWWVSRVNGKSISSMGRAGMQEVESVGFGAMLIDLSVFEAIDTPWFDTPHEGLTHIGEDVYFCRKAREAGFSIVIDHDLSQRVRHSAVVEYGVHSVEALTVA